VWLLSEVITPLPVHGQGIQHPLSVELDATKEEGESEGQKEGEGEGEGCCSYLVIDQEGVRE